MWAGHETSLPPPTHRMSSVQTEEELEKLWKEAENKNLESKDLALLSELYTLKKQELELRR